MTNLNDTLPGLMNRATENLEPVSTDLLERTVHQGLRLRRRRTTLLGVTGAGAVLATAGLVAGGIHLVGNPSDTAVAGTPPKPATPHQPPQAAVTPQQTLATLRSLIQGVTLSEPVARGGVRDGFTAAAYIADDGKGASRVEVLLSGGGEQDRCTDPGAACTVRPDGSTLFTLTEQPEYPGSRNVDGVVSNYIELRFKDGRFISLTSYNAPAEKGSPHTRTKPLFTVAQLTAMAENTAWRFPPKTTVKPSQGGHPKTTVKPAK